MAQTLILEAGKMSSCLQSTVQVSILAMMVGASADVAFVPSTLIHHATTKADKRVSESQDVPIGLQSAIVKARTRQAYAVKSVTDGKSASTYEAINQANNLRFAFERDGMVVTPIAAQAPAWKLRMTLHGYGYEDAVMDSMDMSSRHTTMSTDGNRIEYRHTFDTGDPTTSDDFAMSNDLVAPSKVGRVQPASVSPSKSRRVEPAPPSLASPSDIVAPIVEWYVNDASGLEQGFTITAPPKRGIDTTSPLRLELGIEGDTKAKLSASGAIRFADSHGKTVLRYSQLHVFDATGREHPSHLQMSKTSALAIVMNDQGATYPITVDPLFDTEVKLTASDAEIDVAFGISVSISGDTAIVGANGNIAPGSFPGAAYIFQRDMGGADNWGEVTKLTASDATAGDQFGFSVSISGDTSIVGALADNDAGSISGSAYIFQRNLGGPDNWGEVTKLTASDAAANDQFGRSVSISGDTVIVGAHRNDDVFNDAGSAYIFQRNQGGADNWGEATKLVAPTQGMMTDLAFPFRSAAARLSLGRILTMTPVVPLAQPTSSNAIWADQTTGAKWSSSRHLMLQLMTILAGPFPSVATQR